MSSLSVATCRELFAASRIARFATVTPDGAPHLVPVTCALGTIDGRETIVFAIDHKPKTTTALRRLANIAAEPRAGFLVDAYSEDWTTLWWVRADVTARVIDTDTDTVTDTDTNTDTDIDTVTDTVTDTGTDTGTVGGEHPDAEVYRAAVDLLAEKYPQYRERRPAGAAVLATVTRWTGWSAGSATPGVS